MKINEAINIYQSYIKRQHSEGTHVFYLSHLKHFEIFLSKNDIYEVDDITFNVIDDYIAIQKKTCVNATINKRIGIIKRMFKHLSIDKPFMNTIDKFKERTKTFNMLSREEIKRINKYVLALPDTHNNLMYKGLIVLLTYTGARINELIHIEKKNITFNDDYGSILLTVTKMRKDRTVLFTVQSFKLIKHLMSDNKNEYLFYNKEKKRQMNYDDVRFFMRLLKRKLDINMLHSHMFRHSMATIWLENGADIKSVMLVLGHENMKTTDRYLHNSSEHIKKTYISKFKI